MKTVGIRLVLLLWCALGFISAASAQILSQILQPQPSSSGTFSFVQKSANGASVSSSPISLSLPSTVAGHTIVVYAYVDEGGAGTLAVSDGVNTYTAATGICTNGASAHVEEAFYVLSGAGGSLTISVSYSGSTDWLYANAREYSSTTPVSYVGRACTASPTSTTTPTSDAVNANGTNNLLIGGMYDFNGFSGGCGSGWGNCASNTNQSSAGPSQTEDKLNQASGNYSATFTLNTAESDWTAEDVAFKD